MIGEDGLIPVLQPGTYTTFSYVTIDHLEVQRLQLVIGD